MYHHLRELGLFAMCTLLVVCIAHMTDIRNSIIPEYCLDQQKVFIVLLLLLVLLMDEPKICAL